MSYQLDYYPAATRAIEKLPQQLQRRILNRPIIVSVPWMFLLLAGCSAGNTANELAQQTTPAAANLSPQVQLRSRHEFAKAFARIKEGMTAEQAEAILGKPDDILAEADPGGVIGLVNTRQIWGYGTDRHLGIATLGTVTIDNNDHVQYLCGTQGADKLVGMLGEKELRRLIRLLARGEEADEYNPRDVIEAVNALQPLGKEAGVAVLKEYMRVDIAVHWGEDVDIFLVMRALFEVPPIANNPAPSPSPRRSDDVVQPGYFRPPAIAFAPFDAKYNTVFPRYPLAIVDDVPLLVGEPCAMGGFPEPAEMHLESLQKAQWRNRPLIPTNDPLAVWKKVMDLLPPDQRSEEFQRSGIASQLLALVGTAYRPSASPENDDQYYDVGVAFPRDIQNVRALKIRWNPQSNCYVRSNGSTLPPIFRPIYYNTIFRPKLTAYPDLQCRISVHRTSPGEIWVSVEYHNPKGVPGYEFRVYHLGRKRTLLRKEMPTPGDDCSYGMELPAGEYAQVELKVGDQTFVSPPVEP